MPRKNTEQHEPRNNTEKHGPRNNTERHGPRNNTEKHGTEELRWIGIFPCSSVFFRGLELPNLDLLPGFFLRQSASQIVGEIAPFDAENNSGQLINLTWRERAIAPAGGH
jgi:hypothetical protein